MVKALASTVSGQNNFFTLPLELREPIYLRTIMSELFHPGVLLEEDEKQSCYHRPFGPEEDCIVPILYGFPALFFVSRQLRAEAERMLYSRCTLAWCFRSDIAIAEDLKHVPFRNL